MNTRALYMPCDFIIDFLQTTTTIVFVCFACLTESFCGNSVDRATQPVNSHIAGLWYSIPVSDSCLYRYIGRGKNGVCMLSYCWSVVLDTRLG